LRYTASFHLSTCFKTWKTMDQLCAHHNLVLKLSLEFLLYSITILILHGSTHTLKHEKL
jgi:hypothetical protein